MVSLRLRMLIGVGLWTVGLVLILATSLTFIWHHLPNLPFFGRTGSIHTWVLHSTLVIGLASLFLVAGLWQVGKGLAGLSELRRRLADVHTGRESRVIGRYVSEVQPVVDDLNALLDHRDAAVKRAVAKAGDLAHGLKTPLAVLLREAEVAMAAGQTELADAILQQVGRMRRHVDYHLAHARAAASGSGSGARASIKESAEGLVRTLARIHADRSLTFAVSASEDLQVRVQREDLDELLGNLLDNACKWTRTTVALAAVREGPVVVVTVDDDGQGLPAALREAVLVRGVRADEQTAGSGLGLAIVRDIVELYGGSITLDESPRGGLRAVLRLPGAFAGA